MLNFHSEDMFQPRAVAFLDVLGFKELINVVEKDASKRGPFFSLFTILDSHARFNNQTLAPSLPDVVKPKYIFISDSIIFSVPLEYPKAGGGIPYDGLWIVIAKSIEIAHKLLEMGVLVRGGISVGPVWHTDRNIFGNGYVSAYQTEAKAGSPRILLSPEAKAHWEKNQLRFQTELCIQRKGEVYVNSLHAEYITGTNVHGRIDSAFKQYRAWIVTRLNDLPVGSSPWMKWWWIAEAYNDALALHGVTSPPIDRDWSVR
jgi:hypothetical protein